MISGIGGTCTVGTMVFRCLQPGKNENFDRVLGNVRFKHLETNSVQSCSGEVPVRESDTLKIVQEHVLSSKLLRKFVVAHCILDPQVCSATLSTCFECFISCMG